MWFVVLDADPVDDNDHPTKNTEVYIEDCQDRNELEEGVNVGREVEEKVDEFSLVPIEPCVVECEKIEPEASTYVTSDTVSLPQDFESRTEEIRNVISNEINARREQIRLDQEALTSDEPEDVGCESVSDSGERTVMENPLNFLADIVDSVSLRTVPEIDFDEIPTMTVDLEKVPDPRDVDSNDACEGAGLPSEQGADTPTTSYQQESRISRLAADHAREKLSKIKYDVHNHKKKFSIRKSKRHHISKPKSDVWNIGRLGSVGSIKFVQTEASGSDIDDV